MTTPETPDRDDTAVLAAELALGVLDGAERRDAQRRVIADPAFARAVEAWRAHFAILFAEWPEASVNSEVERRLIARLDAGERFATTGPSRGNGWAWATGAATLLAASLVLALALRPERMVPIAAAPVADGSPTLVAAIAPTGKGKPFAATYDARRGEIRLAGTVIVPRGRSAELWAIGGDSLPHALGIYDGSRGARVNVAGSNARRLAEGVTLAVSIEPVGGSPTGRPTGPVVATGTLSRA